MEKSKKGKIITITSTKGGVGKTITTLNLAGLYSSLGLKTLIIDLDIYGGAIATFVNSNLERNIFNFIDDYTHNRYKQISDYIYSYNDYIDVISSVKDPRFANKIDFKYIPILPLTSTLSPSYGIESNIFTLLLNITQLNFEFSSFIEK